MPRAASLGVASSAGSHRLRTPHGFQRPPNLVGVPVAPKQGPIFHRFFNDSFTGATPTPSRLYYAFTTALNGPAGQSYSQKPWHRHTPR